MQKRKIGFFLLVCSILLGGCWDRREVNDVAFVLGTAVDKEGDNYRTTLQIALPGQLGASGSTGGGGGTSGDKSYYVEGKTGHTVREASIKEQQSNSRSLNYSHRRTLLIGEEMARSGISSMLDVFTRIEQNRLSSVVVIAKGKAADMLEADAPIEQYPAEMVRELNYAYMKEPRSLKLVIDSLLMDGIDPAIPLIAAEESVPEHDHNNNSKTNIKINGLAVFSGDKMVGMVDAATSQNLLLAMGQAKTAEVLIIPPKSKGTISVVISDTRVKIKPVIHGDDIRMVVDIFVSGNMMANESNVSVIYPKDIKWLERETERKVKTDIQSAIHRMQTEMNSDVLGFGQVLATSAPKDWERLKAKWSRIYPEVEVTVKTSMHIENIGAVTKPAAVKDSELTHD